MKYLLVAFISLNAFSLEYIAKVKSFKQLKEVQELTLNFSYDVLIEDSSIVSIDFFKGIKKADAHFVMAMLETHYFVKNQKLKQKQGVVSKSSELKTDLKWSLSESEEYSTKAEAVWRDYGTSTKDALGREIVVAVIDSGFDINHESVNYWKNTEEIPGNGIDDDKNGYIDDYDGWNARAENGEISSGRHGTHVAGIIGANGKGSEEVYGIFPGVKVMPIVNLGASVKEVVKAYGYVLKMKRRWYLTNGRSGANIVATNSSFGVDRANCRSKKYELWNDIYNLMGTNGILNAVATTNGSYDVDEAGDVPSACTSPYIIGVGNIDKNGGTHGGSGVLNVDLHAQGWDIYSTLPGNRYGNMSGTSMATPHVTGSVAYLYSAMSIDQLLSFDLNPAQSTYNLKKLIMRTSTRKAELGKVNYSGGFLNLERAVQALR